MKQKKEVKKLIRKSTNKFENQCCSELDTVPPSLLLSSTPSQSESLNPSTPPSHQCFDDLKIVAAVSRYFSDRSQAEKEWGEIGTWRTCKVTDLSSWNSDEYRLFGNKESFNEGLNKWDVSSVTSLFKTFFGTELFNQPLDQWDVSSVTSHDSTFFRAGYFNQPLNEWDVSNSNTFAETFAYARSFNQPLDEWDVSNSLSFYATFGYTGNFNQPCLKWSINPDADVGSMFTGSDGKLC